MTRARLNWIEFSAMAFGRSSFLNERRDQRLVGRAAERLGAAGDERQRQDVPDRGRRPSRPGPARVKAVVIWMHCDISSSAAPIAAIGHDAADQREQHDRQLAEKGVEPEEERRIGERQNQPVLGDALHPGADAGGEGAEPQDAEIPVGERGRQAPEGPAGRGRAANACRGRRKGANRPIWPILPSGIRPVLRSSSHSQ